MFFDLLDSQQWHCAGSSTPAQDKIVARKYNLLPRPPTRWVDPDEPGNAEVAAPSRKFLWQHLSLV